MLRRPRLIDLFGPDNPKPRLVSRDGNAVAWCESYPIAGEPIALDERLRPSLALVTFDGAAPSRKS